MRVGPLSCWREGYFQSFIGRVVPATGMCKRSSCRCVPWLWSLSWLLFQALSWSRSSWCWSSRASRCSWSSWASARGWGWDPSACGTRSTLGWGASGSRRASSPSSWPSTITSSSRGSSITSSIRCRWGVGISDYNLVIQYWVYTTSSLSTSNSVFFCFFVFSSLSGPPFVIRSVLIGLGCPRLRMVDLSKGGNGVWGRNRGDRANTEWEENVLVVTGYYHPLRLG